MPQHDPSAALYPHLAGRSAPQERPRQRNVLAERVYPGLAPKPPPPRDYYREALVKNLKEAIARHDGRR
jgi:hypothetical protein